jgi:transposase
MPGRHRPDPKRESLKESGTLHPHPEVVSEPLFLEHDFFDPSDLLQVKYEMIRRVEQAGAQVTEVAAAFGVSRPTFYQARAAFLHHGLAGLLPRKRGPHGGHKLTDEVLSFLQEARAGDDAPDTKALVELIKERFALKVHPRSVERALQRGEKKRP